MDKVAGIAAISSLLLNFNVFASSSADIISQNPDPKETMDINQPVKTESKFSTKTITQTETIERKTVSKDDPDKEIGEDTVLDEGADGKKIKTIDIDLYDGQEIGRKVASVSATPAKDKIISKGTKIVWRTLDTPDGQIRYWRMMHVYATHYDSHCPGCNETTAIGMKAGKGVVAVDPSVIKMRSNMYIPGYGSAVAGDTGGAIKGDKIDLGFNDAKTAGWSAHYIDIYLE